MSKRKTHNTKHNDCWNTIGVWSSVADKCEKLDHVVHCRNCDVFSRAGREVLERRPPAGYVTQWRKEIAHQQDESDATQIGVMSFRLGNEWFAMPAKLLQEIAELRTIHRVPHNDNPYIAGIVNIGGEVNVCYSLGNLLGIDKQGDAGHVFERLMVVNYQKGRYIFPVSEIKGMERYREADMVSIPSTLGKKKHFIDGVYLSDNKQIAILNIDQLCLALRGMAA